MNYLMNSCQENPMYFINIYSWVRRISTAALSQLRKFIHAVPSA